MFYNTFNHARGADSIPLFLLVACLGPLLSVFVATTAVPVLDVEVFIPISGLLHGRLPVALTIPTIPHDVPVVAVIQPVAVAVPVVAHIALEPRLIIPSIGVNAAIKEMGETPEGAMAVPDNGFDVAWYGLGTRLGEEGSAVIGGHNRWEEVSAVFEHLDQLEIGDVISVIGVDGVSISFVVRETRTYDPTDAADEIFTSESGVHINLITCSGEFDPDTNTYTKRLVIFADLI